MDKQLMSEREKLIRQKLERALSKVRHVLSFGGFEVGKDLYFRAKAGEREIVEVLILLAQPQEQEERIWIKPHELANLRDDEIGCAIIVSRTEDDGDDEGGDFLPATLIIHEPAQKEREHE